MRRLVVVTALTLAAFAGSPATAELLELEVTGTEATAAIELPGGLGADLAIRFEEALGLGTESLGVSVGTTSASQLLGRLPSGVALPAAFPVVVRIEPPADGPLGFSGVASIELHTHNLNFTANTPLRLFRSHAGGPFVDVTEAMGMGSYRVRGSTGGFSEFVILADTRPIAAVIEGKFDALESILAAADLPGALVTTLQGRINASYSAYRANAFVAAVEELDALADLVRAESGTTIPDVWRSAGDLDNVAGDLRAAAATLRLSLNLRASSGLL